MSPGPIFTSYCWVCRRALESRSEWFACGNCGTPSGRWYVATWPQPRPRNTVARTFPSLINAKGVRPAVLSKTFAISDETACDAVLGTSVVYQQMLSTTSTADLSEWTMRFFHDVAALKLTLTDPSDVVFADFLRFLLATGALSHCVGTGQMSRAYDWLALCLNDDAAVDEERLGFSSTFDRLASFLASTHGSLKRNAANTICTWTWLAYTYCSSMNSLHELAFSALHGCREAIKRHYPDQEAVKALSAMAFWSIDYAPELREAIAIELESLYANGTSKNSASLAVALATSLGNATARGQAGWLAECERVWDLLEPYEQFRIQILRMRDLAVFDQDRDRLFKLFEAFQAPSDAPIAAAEQFMERNASQLGPLITQLIRAGRSHDALAVLIGFYGVASLRNVDDVLFCVPFTTKGALWAHNERVCEASQLVGGFDSAMKTLKDALGLSFGSRDEPTPIDRYGVPNEALGHSLVEATADLLALNSIDLEAFDSDLPCMIFSSSPFPHQATILARRGRTWPLAISFKKRQPNRLISKIAIWQHGGLALAEQEANGLRMLFESAHVQVILEQGGSDSDHERFIALYEDPSFDLLWVTGHGKHVAFAPDENSLGIYGLVADVGIKATSLVNNVPESEKRRLLVLNVCDGAKPTGYANGLPRLSIAGLCTSDRQAVISHLWPLHFVPACAFGLTLGVMLSRHGDYFSAYCETVRLLMSGNDAVADSLADAGLTETAIILRGSSIDLSNPINSYSAAYYE